MAERRQSHTITDRLFYVLTQHWCNNYRIDISRHARFDVLSLIKLLYLVFSYSTFPVRRFLVSLRTRQELLKSTHAEDGY